MNIKRIIMFAAAGLVSFVGTFCFIWLTAKAPERTQAAGQLESQRSADAEMLPGLPAIASASVRLASGGKDMPKAMTEKQLKSLIFEIREKVQAYDDIALSRVIDIPACLKLKSKCQYEQAGRNHIGPECPGDGLEHVVRPQQHTKVPAHCNSQDHPRKDK